MNSIFQQAEDKRRTSTSIHKPFAAAAAGGAEITQVLVPKTRRLFICRFLSQRNDTHSEAMQQSVFTERCHSSLYLILPLSLSSSYAFVVYWGSLGVVSLGVAHGTVWLLVLLKSDSLKGD